MFVTPEVCRRVAGVDSLQPVHTHVQQVFSQQSHTRLARQLEAQVHICNGNTIKMQQRQVRVVLLYHDAAGMGNALSGPAFASAWPSVPGPDNL